MPKLLQERVQLSDFEKALINRLQNGLPLTSRPFLAVAEELKSTESAVLKTLQKLLNDGVLTRLGPMFQIERLGGAFSLVAVHADEKNFAFTVEKINAHAEVAHNYERAHFFNIWFVLACAKKDDIPRVLKEIETETGAKTFAFPKKREFFVEFKPRAK